MKRNFHLDGLGYALGVCLIAALVIGSYWFLSHYVFSRKPVNVFVEMKIIDEQGHPVAGAEIFQEKKRIGVSDAFGEWSQFVSVILGSTVPILVRKQNGKLVMGAFKNITIPAVILMDQEPRIKANVRLHKKWKDGGHPPETGFNLKFSKPGESICAVQGRTSFLE